MTLPNGTAIIPARGGSQRIPRKNIKPFFGKPIICYSIETARASGLFNLILVSTDDDEIEEISLSAGAVVMRRKYDDGTQGTQEVAQKVLEQMPHVVTACVIYATCPLLTTRDLTVGLVALGYPNKQFAMSVGPNGRDAGCFYWGKADAFRDDLKLEAPHTARVELPSARCIDINTPADWSRAEAMYEALRRANK